MHVSRAGSEPCASGLCVSVRLGDVLLGELLDDGLFVVERDAEFFLEVDANLLHGDRLQVNAGEHLLDRILEFLVGGRRGGGRRDGGAGRRGLLLLAWRRLILGVFLLSNLLFLLV